MSWGALCHPQPQGVLMGPRLSSGGDLAASGLPLQAPAWVGKCPPFPALNTLGHRQNVSPAGLIRSGCRLMGLQEAGGGVWEAEPDCRVWCLSGEKCHPTLLQGGWA